MLDKINAYQSKINSDFYNHRADKLRSEKSGIVSELKQAEDEAKKSKQDEVKFDAGPAVKFSISQEARDLAALQLGNK